MSGRNEIDFNQRAYNYIAAVVVTDADNSQPSYLPVLQYDYVSLSLCPKPVSLSLCSVSLYLSVFSPTCLSVCLAVCLTVAPALTWTFAHVFNDYLISPDSLVSLHVHLTNNACQRGQRLWQP